MKQYIAIAALIAAGATFASADEYTINPLSNESAYNYYTGQGEQISYTEYMNDESGEAYRKTNWSSTADGWVANPTLLGNNKYGWKENKVKGVSSYTDFDTITLDSADDYLKFSYRLNTGNSKKADAMLTLALVGAEGAIVTGFTGTKPVSYAVTDVVADSYAFAGATWTDATLSGKTFDSLLTATGSSGYYTVEGSVAWDETVSEFVLNLLLSKTAQEYVQDENGVWQDEPVITTTLVKDVKVSIGDGFGIEELIISINGTSNAYPELYDLALTWGSASFSVPEPSTFGLLAGLGALALAGTRRRRR